MSYIPQHGGALIHDQVFKANREEQLLNLKACKLYTKQS